MAQEIYVSTDIEADGPIPGPHSMLSFASAAFTAEKQLVGTFSCNLETLPDAQPDPRTAEWWRSQPEAWRHAAAICDRRPKRCATICNGSRNCPASRCSSAIRRPTTSCSSIGT